MDGLRKAGHESTLLARESSPLWVAALEAGFTLYPAEAKQVWQRARRVDIVHAHDARAHTIAAIASKRKFVVSRRVAFPVRRSVSSIWKYQRAARFLAVSRFVAAELRAAGIREEKIDVVYDGVSGTTSNTEWNASHPAVALASTDPQKGRDLVAQAAQIANVPLVFSRELPRDLQHASMFVYITRSEGLGSAALLAMSMGVPVIASRVGGLTEVFAHEISGIFVANETDEIGRAMRSLLDRPSFTEGLIEAAKERIRECFTQEHLVRRTVLSYGRVLGI